ncbi:MAG: dihydropteroate synthase [Rhodobacteraceae bacterium]|nr:dihydropteroate synthase [Paracoccaceae bacterium]
MKRYYRPIALHGSGLPLAGGWLNFRELEEITRDGSRIIAADAAPSHVLEALTSPRADVAGLSLDAPRIMGIVNTTPDSFSDGGRLTTTETAIAHAQALAAQGAHILDIGGESTRPGADFVEIEEEVARTVPVIEGLNALVSIDTRKAAVAEAALGAGAAMLNDVSGLLFDPVMALLAARSGAPICVMHSKGDPKTMQQDPRYENVLLDVYDALEAQITMAEAAGVARSQIIVDPGIGFGKTLEHNLTLLKGLSLLHSLGCAILLGASRKRFIGTISEVDEADQRVAGSLAVALAGVAQGVQILRVHDVEETRQALALWQAST